MILGMSFDRVDQHKNIIGTKRRRTNNSSRYSAPRLSRYVDRDLGTTRKRSKENLSNKIQTPQYWQHLVHVQWANDQEVPLL